MKSLVLSMLAIASMAAMSSCSSENDPVDEVINAGNQEKVEIKIAAGVLKAETKAPVDDSTPTTVSILRKDGNGAWDATNPISVAISGTTDNIFQVIHNITIPMAQQTHLSLDFIQEQYLEVQ